MNNFKNYVSFIFLTFFLFAFYSYLQENIEVFNQITSIKIVNIFLIFLISFIIYLIKAKINIDIYSFSKIRLSITESLKIVSRSAAINLSGPVNIGAGYKIHYLKKKYDLNIIENFSINTAYAFYLNYFYIVIIFLVTLPINKNLIENNIYINLFLLLIIIALLIFIKIISSYKLEKIKINILSDIIEKLLIGFQYFKNDIENVRKLIISSVVYLSVSIIYYQIIMSSVGFNISLYSLLVMHCLLSMVNLIKITPGNIGFLEVSLIFFQSLHGITTSEIIVFSVVLRIVSFVSLFLLFGIDKFINKN